MFDAFLQMWVIEMKCDGVAKVCNANVIECEVIKMNDVIHNRASGMHILKGWLGPGM
jgi:hypothetical protein